MLYPLSDSQYREEMKDTSTEFFVAIVENMMKSIAEIYALQHIIPWRAKGL